MHACNHAQAQAAEAVIKLNKGIGNVRCFLSKSQNRGYYTTSRRREAIGSQSAEEHHGLKLLNFQVIPLAEELPMSWQVALSYMYGLPAEHANYFLIIFLSIIYNG